MFNTRIKILVGYALLAIVLLSTTWMVYDNTRSLIAVNHASERLLQRRNIVDSLMYSMLETANAERAVLLGDIDEWGHFEHALKNSATCAMQLRPMIADSSKQQRLDSLVVLLEAKRTNTLLVMRELDKDSHDIYYNNKVKALHSGRDSIVIHPQTKEMHEQHETVYEVVKSRRGFFRRLGDAFRRQYTDTLSTTRITQLPSTDTINHRLNIADSVANALTEIHQEQRKASNRQQSIINSRNSQLQMVSLQLTRQAWQLLEDIQADEHTALQNAIGTAISSRWDMIVRIGVLGLLAILSAAILVAYILRDIRRERRDRQRIIEAKAETERIMEQRERLLLTITHDIKAPAASIAGFIDLLDDYVDSPKGKGYLQSIGGSAKHLLQLVSALLDYHQLESGKAECHEVSFAPATLARECVEQLLPLAMAKQLKLTADIRVAEHTICRSDAFRIKQIVNNLLSNAIKYTDKGEVRLAIGISKGNICISVADTGCGMTADELQRVFNAFTRLPGAQGREGVGLGLTITREITTLLGGTISATSQKQHGTTFNVSIPVRVTVGDNCTKQADKGATAQSTEAPQSLAVLIVDDDHLQQQLLTEMLGHIEGANFNICATTHANEAISIAISKTPNIVFTDIEMPEMNGTEIMKRIRSNPQGMPQSTKFVAMTAHEQSIMPQLRSNGFDACLFKPFNVQTLAATICQLTGVMVRVKSNNSSHSEAACNLRSALLPFTDGCPEAEQQIVDDIRKSIDEYLCLLGDATDAQSIAKAAHKAMPLLEMLRPGGNEWLKPLTPEHIDNTAPQQRAVLTERLTEQLKQIRLSTL